MNNTNTELRHELKYYISYSAYIALRHRLKLVMREDPHALDDKGYFVSSLYFDDIDDKAMREKLAGLIYRQKIRIRIYNNCDSHIRLERKSRFEGLVKKESKKISIDEYNEILLGNYEFLSKDKTKISQRFYIDFKYGLLKPAVIVDYRREAYILDYEDIRITFDKMICSRNTKNDLFDENYIFLRAVENNVVVMEVKYNNFLPDYIRSLIQVASCQMLSISKYVLCREIKTSIVKRKQEY